MAQGLGHAVDGRSPPTVNLQFHGWLLAPRHGDRLVDDAAQVGVGEIRTGIAPVQFQVTELMVEGEVLMPYMTARFCNDAV